MTRMWVPCWCGHWLLLTWTFWRGDCFGLTAICTNGFECRNAFSKRTYWIASSSRSCPIMCHHVSWSWKGRASVESGLETIHLWCYWGVNGIYLESLHSAVVSLWLTHKSLLLTNLLEVWEVNTYAFDSASGGISTLSGIEVCECVDAPPTFLQGWRLFPLFPASYFVHVWTKSPCRVGSGSRYFWDICACLFESGIPEQAFKVLSR